MASDYDATEPATFFVRALYDYRSNDASSLTFRKGDLIEVLTQLPSGWWDGLLNDERGWFPSNYVVPVPEDELEREFGDKGYYQDRQDDVAGSPRAPSVLYSDPKMSWLSHDDASMPISSMNLVSSTSQSVSTQSLDSWIPKISESGHIYYFNLDTGEERVDPPDLVKEVSEEILGSSTDTLEIFGGFRPQSVNGKVTETVGVGQRSRTPEPWIRKLTEDGMAYYYWNSISHEVRWTPPSPILDPTSTFDLRALPYLDGSGAKRGAVSSAATDFAGLYDGGPFYGGNLPDAFVELGYSKGYDFATNIPLLASNSSTHSAYSAGPRPGTIRRLPDAPLVDGQKALEYALDLQMAMNPETASQLVMDLSVSARDAIQVVIDTASLVMDESPSTPRDGIDFVRERRLSYDMDRDGKIHPHLSGRVAEAASAVLALLLASGKLLHHVEEVDEAGALAAPEYLRAISTDPLTGFHRKVAANLSRLILSSRAADSLPDRPQVEMAAALERDAQDLEKSVITFVLELNKVDTLRVHNRLRAALSPGRAEDGIGTGIIGGGAAARWKGNGFVAPEDDNHDSRPLDGQAMQALNELHNSADRQLTNLSEVVTMAYRQQSELLSAPRTESPEKADPVVAEVPAERGGATVPQELSLKVTGSSQAAVSRLNALLEYTESLDLASELDFDGNLGSTMHPQEITGPVDEYESSVRRARQLMRAFEILKQTVYDHGAELLLHAQSSFGAASLHSMLIIIPSLKSDMTDLVETLAALTDIIAFQAEAIQNGRSGRLGSRSLRHVKHPHEHGAGVPITFGIASARDTSTTLGEAFEEADHALAEVIHPFSAAAVPDSRSRSTGMKPDLGASNDDGLYTPGGVDVVAQTAGHVVEVNPADPDFDLPDESRRNNHASPTVMSRRERKLKNLLGPDAPIAAQTTPSEPEYMRRMYGPPDILLNSDLGVRGGTLPALVEHLTLHNRLDSTFNETFLMTFKSFATVDEVVSELIKRFNLPPPDNLTPEQFTEWKEMKQKRYRFRTMNILKALIQSQTLDQRDLHVLDRIREFAESIQEPDMVAPKMQVLQTIKMRTDEAQAKKYTANGLQNPPPSILPKSLKKFKLNELDPIELARQLTIMENRLFNRVHPTECLERGKDKPTTSMSEDNIKAIINMSNKMAGWVSDTVLAKEEVKKRASVLRYWISVAEQCKRLKNFSTMAALIAGLNCPPIRRLRRSWEQVHQKATSVLADLEKTIDSVRNFAEYRKLLASINPPCVPFFGLFLKDLTFIQDGNNNFIPVAGGKVINFDKRQKQSQVIREIQRYQSATYDLIPVDAIIEFIEQSLDAIEVEHDYWPLSLEREPREREEERMARLLQESGFL